MALEVPSYDQPIVRQAALPTPMRPQSAPLASFGGGPAAAGAFQAADEAVKTAGAINQQEFNHEAEAAVRDYMSQLSAEEARLKAKAETMKGAEAFGATDAVVKEFDQTRDKMVQGIGNPIVRDKVRGHADSFRNSLARSTELYVAQERDNFDKTNTKALIERERDNALTGYIDPDSPAKPARVMEAISRQRAAVADQLHGQSKATIEGAQAVQESRTHLEVLHRMLTGGNDLLGKHYYEANQAGFYGDDKIQAEGWLKTQSTLSEAQRIEDKIFSTTYEEVPNAKVPTEKDIVAHYAPTTQKEAMDRVLEVTKDSTPEIRKMAEQMVLNRYHKEVQANKELTDNIFEQAAKTVRQTGSLPDVATLNSLPEEDRGKLDRMMSGMAKGGSPYAKVSDPKETTRFMNLPQDELAKLSEAEMLRYVPMVTEAKYGEMEKLWKTAMGKDDASSFAVKSEDERHIFSSAKVSGLAGLTMHSEARTLTESQAKAFAPIRDEIAKRMEAAWMDNGKKLTQKEREGITKDYVIEKAVDQSDTRWYHFLVGKPIMNIPEADKQRIIKSVKDISGSEPSQAKLEVLYRAQVLGASPLELRRLAAK